MAIFAVPTGRGPNWDDRRPIREQRAWTEHAQFADQLVARGVILVGGPIGDGSDDDVALMAVEASDEGQLRSIFLEDPWSVVGVFRIKEVRPWTWWLDARRVPRASW
jgi:uncharacterized protein YciI